MTLTRMRRLSTVILIAGVAGADLGASQAQQPFFWWRSEDVRKELKLTADQVSRIDKIFESTRPELRQEMDELTRYDAKFQKLIETSTDEALLARQIDRVETARANLNKTRSLMIARMRLVLSPEQRQRLKVVYERRESQNRENANPNKPSGEQRPPAAQGPSDSRDQRRPLPDLNRSQSPESSNRPGF
jgi:Spy/CpxP family protein refolding chaperone